MSDSVYIEVEGPRGFVTASFSESAPSEEKAVTISLGEESVTVSRAAFLEWASAIICRVTVRD